MNRMRLRFSIRAVLIITVLVSAIAAPIGWRQAVLAKRWEFCQLTEMVVVESCSDILKTDDYGRLMELMPMPDQYGIGQLREYWRNDMPRRIALGHDKRFPSYVLLLGDFDPDDNVVFEIKHIDHPAAESVSDKIASDLRAAGFDVTVTGSLPNDFHWQRRFPPRWLTAGHKYLYHLGLW